MRKLLTGLMMMQGALAMAQSNITPEVLNTLSN